MHNEQTGGFPPNEMERRGLPRWHLDDTATLVLDSRFDVQCPLRDISGSGMAAQTSLRPNVGDEAVVYVRALGRFRAEVMRVASDHVAFRFLIEDEHQIMLLERLERRMLAQAADTADNGGGDDPVVH